MVSRVTLVDERAQTQPVDVHAERGVRSALVGRDAELRQMADVVQNAADFKAPQLITIIGNQGTGKTRLIEELVASAVKPPMRVYTGRATQGGPKYGAISAFLRDRFNLRPGDDPGAARLSFRAGVQEIYGDANIAEVLHLLGSFVDLSFEASAFLQVLRDNRAQYEDVARTVLRRTIELDAAQSPSLLVFDDLQWADDDTLGLLRELAAGLGGCAVVLIASARPDMIVRCPDWGEGATDHLRIELRNLEPDDAEDMFRALLEQVDDLPEDVVDDAIEMTGGNPYFVEELVRLFLSNGTIDVTGPVWTIDPDAAADTRLPISIEEAIEARIAALEAPERDLLEKGAVFGNVFWTGAIVALSRIEDDEAKPSAGPPRPNMSYDWTPQSEAVRARTERLVEELVDRDYLLRLDPDDSTIPGDVELVFKHNLERDLIARSTAVNKVERYHRLAAQWLETKLSARSEEQLEFLAQLYEKGGDRRRAARCYFAGGDKARGRYANDLAVELYSRGLAMIEDGDALARLEALHNLGDVLDLVGRTDEALARFSEMLRLAWLFDHLGKGGAAHSRLGRIYRRRGEYDRAMAHLREANDLFARANDRRGVAGTLDDIGTVHWLQGSYGQALTFYRQALSIRRALGDRRSIALSLANIGRVHHDSGAFKAAVEQFREALDLRRDSGDMAGVVQSLADLGGVHLEDGNYEMALDLFNEAAKIAGDIGDRRQHARVLASMGECEAAMGLGDAAVRHLEEAIKIATALADRVTRAHCLLRMAEVQLGLGDSQRAFEHGREALGIAEQVSARVQIGRAHRVLAEATAAGGFSPEERARAAEHFRSAVEVLAGIKNELELARCYRAFGVFRERCGEIDDAGKLRRRADEIFARLRGAASVD